MEERNYEIRFVKSKDPNKLTIFHATSYDDHVSVYVNKNQCFSCYEKDEKFLILFQNEEDDRSAENPEFKKMGAKYIKITNIFRMISIITIVFISLVIKNFYLLVFLYNIVIFLSLYIRTVIYYELAFSETLKRHHSAEHIMVNFTMENMRLPRSIEEARKNASRFSKECGTRELIENIGEIFLISIISFFISFLFMNTIPLNLSKISFLGTYALFFIILKLVKQESLIKVMIEKFNLILSYGIQCVNTSKKSNIQDVDLKMAYYVVKAYVQAVYPEFYEKNDDDETIPIILMEK